jgi:hypothetical protein
VLPFFLGPFLQSVSLTGRVAGRVFRESPNCAIVLFEPHPLYGSDRSYERLHRSAFRLECDEGFSGCSSRQPYSTMPIGPLPRSPFLKILTACAVSPVQEGLCSEPLRSLDVVTRLPRGPLLECFGLRKVSFTIGCFAQVGFDAVAPTFLPARFSKARFSACDYRWV